MCPDIASQFAAMPEDGNRGDAADTKPGCQRAFRIGIDLAENGAPLELPGCFGKHRRHGQTGLTPRCPEIDDDRKVATLDKRIEIGQRQFDWRSRQNGLLADAADRIIVRALVGHAIDGLAMMADDFHVVLSEWIQSVILKQSCVSECAVQMLFSGKVENNLQGEKLLFPAKQNRQSIKNHKRHPSTEFHSTRILIAISKPIPMTCL